MAPKFSLPARRLPSGDRPLVTFLLRNLNQYRLSFYELLREGLDAEGIDLRLVTASGMVEDAEKGDVASLEWAEHRPFKEVKIKGVSLLWQPGFDLARASDLLITEQASKQLFNIVLAYGQGLLGTRHAFWGHGRNLQASHETESGTGEGLKQRLTSRAHWFFSYNDMSTDLAVDAGMQRDRVTPTMNATDTKRIRDALAGVDAARVRDDFGFGDGPLALFMGGLSPKKRVDFLLESAIAIRQQVPDFELVVIGDGPVRDLVSDACERHPWIHWLGAMYDESRVAPASVCSVQLMPGLVGLNIVDAFALGIPTVTTGIDWHSPEIDYLQHDRNGLMLPEDTSPDHFADEVARLLGDGPRVTAMQAEAALWGERLSSEDMADRFVQGILEALAAPRRS